jgi:hypothetical protein
MKKIRVLKIQNVVDCLKKKDCRGRDRILVGFITTYGISAYHH